MKRFAALLLLIPALVACGGDDRECLRGHNQVILVPQTNYVGTTPITTMHQIWVYHCDEYAQETS